MPTSDSPGNALAATLRPAPGGYLVRLVARLGLGAVMAMRSGAGAFAIRLPAWPLEPVGGFLRVTGPSPREA